MDSSSTILRVASARLAGLEGGDLGFKPGILGAAEGAKAVELADLTFSHRPVVHLQLGLPPIFMVAAVVVVHLHLPAQCEAGSRVVARGARGKAKPDERFDVLSTFPH